MDALHEFRNDALFIYRAVVVDVYDGDTITCHVDLGFAQWSLWQRFRLYGIDAPELRGDTREEGIKSRDALRELLPTNAPVLIKTHRDKKGSFGRWLATIIDSKGTDINEWLIANGFAVPYRED